MANDPIGIGIIGSGGIAQSVHLPAYAKLQEEGKVKIVAVADANEATAKAAQEKFGVPHAFTDYKQLLDLAEINAVNVCTPNFLHKQPTVDALNAGKHVIVEKPIALNAVEGQEMVDAAKRNGKKLQVALNIRFNSGPQAVKRFIKEGGMGEIYYARAHALRRRGVPGWGVFTQKDKQGGGPLIDIGVHILDLTLWLMDYPEPASVSGTTYTKFGTKEGVLGLMGQWDPKIYTVEDFAAGLVKFKNGASLVLESSFIANVQDREEMRTNVMGTNAGATVDPFNDANTKIYREEFGTLTDSQPVFLPKVGSHEMEIRSFVQAIIDDTPVEVPGEQGLMVTRILDAIYASSEQKKEIVF
jgi:predicted dehydrogenase